MRELRRLMGLLGMLAVYIAGFAVLAWIIAQGVGAAYGQATPIPTWTPVAQCSSDTCSEDATGQYTCRRGFIAGDQNQCEAPNVIHVRDNRGGHDCPDTSDPGIEDADLLWCDADGADATVRWVLRRADLTWEREIEHMGEITAQDEFGTFLTEYVTGIAIESGLELYSVAEGIAGIAVADDYVPSATANEWATQGLCTSTTDCTHTAGITDFTEASRLRIDGEPVRIHRETFRSTWNLAEGLRYLPRNGAATSTYANARIITGRRATSLDSVIVAAYDGSGNAAPINFGATFGVAVNGNNGSTLCTFPSGESIDFCDNPGAKQWDDGSTIAVWGNCGSCSGTLTLEVTLVWLEG